MAEGDRGPALPESVPQSVRPGPSSEAPEQGLAAMPARFNRRLLWRLGLSLAIAAFFVWVMRAGAMPLIPKAETLHAVRWWTVVGFLVGWSGVHVLRAVRWKVLLTPIAEVSLRRVLVASFIGYLAILVLPLRAGEVVRPVMIREQGRLSGWAAAGTLAAERIVDALMVSVILFIGLQVATPLDPLPERLGDLPISVAFIPRAAYTALMLFTAALLVMLAFYRWKRATRRFIRWALGGISPRLSEWVAARIESVGEGLSFLSRWRHSVPFLLMTAAYWLLNVACTWLLGWGAGFDEFSYAQASVVTGVLAMGIMIPNAPGFFGAFQFSLYAGLAIFYPRDQVMGEGSALVFLMYLSQTLITLAFAAWAALAGRRLRQAGTPRSSLAPTDLLA